MSNINSGFQGTLTFNDTFGKFTNQTSSVKQFAKHHNIDVGTQNIDGKPTALTLKVTSPNDDTYSKDSQTTSYFKADYDNLDVRDLPLFASEMVKLNNLDAYKGKNNTYRALIGNDIRTIDKEKYESPRFDFTI